MRHLQISRQCQILTPLNAFPFKRFWCHKLKMPKPVPLSSALVMVGPISSNKGDSSLSCFFALQEFQGQNWKSFMAKVKKWNWNAFKIVLPPFPQICLFVCLSGICVLLLDTCLPRVALPSLMHTVLVDIRNGLFLDYPVHQTLRD